MSDDRNTLDLAPTGAIRALYQLTAQSVEVVVRDPDPHAGHRTLRITARRRLPDGDYCAAYEERIESELDGADRTLWVETEFPWADGATVEECLRQALALVGAGSDDESDSEVTRAIPGDGS